MCKITLTDEEGRYNNCLASENETPENIMRYFRVNTKTNNVYMNGKIISKETFTKPIPNLNVIYFSVKPKTVARA